MAVQRSTQVYIIEYAGSSIAILWAIDIAGCKIFDKKHFGDEC
jgi:hypothetical protein